MTISAFGRIRRMKLKALGEMPYAIRIIWQIYSGWLNRNLSPNTLNEIKDHRRMRRMKLSALGENA
jgi:hypothetical protein